MVERHPCPRCNRTYKATGKVELGGTFYPVFQCMECLDDWEVEGEKFELALTWAVDGKGGIFLPEMIDPAHDQN